ncbi:hypothetical protein TRAPUB_3383 [Trametes pubescens]|uniref:HMG box domain-containing protein n=1 Tax=Trametes pubescens TaxID=154538 RepID=A0A1M2VDW2_TRAPU|nr:hypothetical protein TRAPUB_3383 [Trametes pubescens]
MPAVRIEREHCKASAPIDVATTSAAADIDPAPTDIPEVAPEYIPRPSNCFFLFRSKRTVELRSTSAHASTNENVLSGIIRDEWYNATEEFKAPWRAAARAAAEEHKRKYPLYTYRPGAKAQLRAEQKKQAEQKKAAKAAAAPKTPSEAAAPRRKSRRTSAPSTSAAGPSRSKAPEGAAALPGMGWFALSPDSDADSRLSSATPSLEFDGETLRRLPFPLQPTATAFVPAAVPDYLQPAPAIPQTAPAFPQLAPTFSQPALDGSYGAPEVVQGSSAHVFEDDFVQGPSMASPTFSSECDLSREWYGPPPRPFFDATFPSHLPIAGTEEPIDFEDAMFALNSAQSSGVAWMAHPPQIDAGADLFALSPAAAYGLPTASEYDMLASGADAASVHHARDELDFDAAAGDLLPSFKDPVVQLLEDQALTYPHQPLAPHVGEPIDLAASSELAFTGPQQAIGDETVPQRFEYSIDEVDRFFASIGALMPSL